MKILLGTTNPSKAIWFEQLLEDYPVEILTLRDLGIDKIPDEDGATPQENAMRKALWYGQYCDRVITNDSGLYLLSLPLDDPRQPGLFVRRAPDGHPMTDEEMIVHYSALAASLGGETKAGYRTGYGIFCEGKLYGLMEDEREMEIFSFRLVSTLHPDRHPGWPLDSLSIEPQSGKYFVERPIGEEYGNDTERAAAKRDFNHRLRRLLIDSFGLETTER